MKLTAFSLRSLAVLTAFIGSTAMATTWSIDPAHSVANFKVKHLMITNVNGQISGLSGDLELDEKDITKSKITASLDAATINTNDAKRDEHLRSPDFFNVAKHPKITFATTSISGKAGDLKVSGKLTMNGVTKDVVLDVDGPSDAIKGMRGEMRRGLSASAKINRKDFGIVWNKNMDGGGILVGDDVSINIDLQLISADKKS